MWVGGADGCLCRAWEGRFEFCLSPFTVRAASKVKGQTLGLCPKPRQVDFLKKVPWTPQKLSIRPDVCACAGPCPEPLGAPPLVLYRARAIKNSLGNRNIISPFSCTGYASFTCRKTSSQNPCRDSSSTAASK